MTLDDAIKIAQAVPGIKFSISAIDHGMGTAFAADIDILEHMAERLPVVKTPIPSKHVHIAYAFTDE